MASASLWSYSMVGWNGQSFRPLLPLEPVRYPPCCGKGPTFRYFFQSKILALAFLILGIAFFVAFIATFLPYWFFLRFNARDSTYGSESIRTLSKDLGLFFYTDDDYVSLLFLERTSNRNVVPPLFTKAQLWEVLSLAALFCSWGGALILTFRKYASVTGILYLAALSTLAAVGQVLMVVFAALSLLSSANDVCEIREAGCKYGENQPWRNLPFNEQFRRVRLHTTPKMEANWAFYIACIGAALAVAGCVLLWLEGLMVCRSVGNIRYQQLQVKRDVYENEREPTDFIHSPPSLVRAQPGMYSGMGMGMAYAPPRQTYRPAPSFSGASTQSGSAYNMSREVDL